MRARTGAESPHTAVRDYVDALLVAVLIALFFRTFVVQAFRIPTGSMEKSLLVGDHLLVNKFIYGESAWSWERRLLPARPPQRGDVIVFRYPEDPRQDFIKRCLALPGDEVLIRDKRLFLNDLPLDETPYAFHADETIYPDALLVDDFFRRRDNLGPYTVPDGHCFFLGDNRDLSNDSRYWGPVPRHYIKGRALLIYWSDAGRPASGPGWRDRLEQIVDLVTHFGSRTRWQRSLRLVR